ncbi:MAG: YceH family protein [Verrucomicrobia bacterium]|nr:YceH family protein [Verrucomicrobiota bacterium]
MDMLLSADEVRVLGALIEKEMTTPEYCPLSLNALKNACSQKSNRDPVVAWDETAVARIVEGLRDKRLIALVTGATSAISRVPKYSQRLAETVGMDERDRAVMCELMVRGPQTAAQLRGRAERLHKFADQAEIEATLNELMTRAQPLVTRLPRQPGHKEQRYAHLLSGPPAISAEAPEPPPEPAVLRVRAENDRLGKLEAEVAALRAELAGVREQIETLRKQLGA